MFDKLFDFGDISNFVQTMTSSANQVSSAERELAEKAQIERQNVTAIAEEYNRSAQKSLDRLKTVDAKGDEARRMAESDNIFDRITLIGEQILNPRDYTAEGRSRQIGEMSQTLAAEGQMQNVAMQAAGARIDQATAERNLKVANATAGSNLLKAQVDGLALANNALINTESLRQNMLTQQDLPTLQKTIAASGDQNDQQVMIGGMRYTPTEVRERIKALETREQLSLLSPQATDPQFAQKLTIHQNLQLANYALPDLEQLRQNSYIMPDGTQVSPQLFDEHYTRQTNLQQQVLTTQMNKLALENQVPMMLKESETMAMNLQTYAQPGSPLAVARNNFIATQQHVAALAASDTTPNGKMVAVKQLQEAQQSMIGAIDREASRKAGGDKDLAQIYRSQMLGQEVQPAMVEDLMRSRYIKGGGFGDFLPNEAAIRVKKNADLAFETIRKASASNLDPMAPTKSTKEMKEEAIQQAMEKERAEAGVNGINMIQRSIGLREDNPGIKAGMLPIEFEQMQTRAFTMAMDTVMKRENLTPAQMNALKAGRPQDAGISPDRANQINQAINIESVFSEYDMYERRKPGLGYEMQQWYSKVMPEMARNYTAGLKTMEKTMAGDGVLLEAQKLAQMYTLADESVTERGRKMVTEVATGAKKPENMWPVLLQMQTNLADSQKQTIFYDIIQPAIQAARSNGANDEVASNSAFEALSKFRSDDPTLMSALKQMQRGLPDELDRFNLMWASMMIKGEPSKIRGARVANDPNLASDKLDKVLPWLNRN